MAGLFRINNNTTATFARRQLGNASARLNESQERLASGKRINSASDDAAGLAISEKLTQQRTGLNQASQNAQDAISLLQTAEGGYKSINSILQRLRELAVRASNDSLTNEDRRKIEQERQQLTEQIDQYHDQVDFNGIKLLQGLGEGGDVWENIRQSVATSLAGGSPSDVDVTVSFTPTGTPTNNGPSNTPQDYQDPTGPGSVNQNEFQNQVVSALEEWSQVMQGEWGFELDITNLGVEDDTNPPSTSGEPSYDLDEDDDGTVDPGEPGDFRVSMPSIDGTFGIVGNGFSPGGNLGETGEVGGDLYFDRDDDWRRDSVSAGTDPGSLSVKNIAVSLFGTALGLDTNTNPDSVMNNSASLQSFSTEHGGSIPNVDRNALKSLYESKPLQFHVGSNRDETISVFLQEVSSRSLKIRNVNLETRESAEQAIQAYTSAIDRLSKIRARVGGKINRFETTIDFVEEQEENTQASNSRIEDADIAEETVKRTRQNILLQAGTSVLAQANTSPELALQLL
jgi:flagellin